MEMHDTREHKPSRYSITQPVCPFGLESILDTVQLVIRKEKLQINEEVNNDVIRRYEIVDETRKVLYLAEQLPITENSGAFRFSIYGRTKEEIIRVLCPSSNLCTCCGATWHCFKRCDLQAVVYCPPGVVAGFVKRQHSWFVQDIGILGPAENELLCLRGALNDLEVYSADCVDELGRLSRRGWVGIMHELRQSRADWGVTYPMDLDVRVKACLLAAVFVVDWMNEAAGR